MGLDFLGSFSGVGGRIKSIQTGTIDLTNATSNTATITSVDVNNAFLVPAGATYSTAGPNDDNGTYTLELTNATTVTAKRHVNPGVAAFPIRYFVVEFYPGTIKSVQKGEIQLNGGTSATATITSVDTTKSVVFHLGFRLNIAAASNWNIFWSQLTLTSATVVTATIAANPGASHLTSFQVVEFY